jgi:hypothetical protein
MVCTFTKKKEKDKAEAPEGCGKARHLRKRMKRNG